MDYKIYLKKTSVVLLSTFMISLVGTFVKTDYALADGPGDTSSSDGKETQQVNSSTMGRSNVSNTVALPSINGFLNNAPILLLPSSIFTPTANDFNGMQLQTQLVMQPPPYVVSAMNSLVALPSINGFPNNAPIPLLPSSISTPTANDFNGMQLQTQLVMQPLPYVVSAMNSLNDVNPQNQLTKHLKVTHRRDIYGKGPEAQKIKQYLGCFDAVSCRTMRLLQSKFPVARNGLIQRDALYSIMGSVNSYLQQNGRQPLTIPRCAKRNHSVFVKYIDDNLDIIEPILKHLQII